MATHEGKMSGGTTSAVREVERSRDARRNAMKKATTKARKKVTTSVLARTAQSTPAKSTLVKSTPSWNREPITPSWVGRMPQLKPGSYADGMPLHPLHYLCCKLILRPNKFVSRQSFFDFGKVMKGPAKQHGVKFSSDGFESQPVKLREVIFMDTEDFRLYNNAFILRRRIEYKDGFPVGEPEIVFKF